MTPQQAHSVLIRVAAQLARGDGLPSSFAEDYKHKTAAVADDKLEDARTEVDALERLLES